MTSPVGLFGPLILTAGPYGNEVRATSADAIHFCVADGQMMLTVIADDVGDGGRHRQIMRLSDVQG